MSLNIEVQQTNGRPGPERALTLNCRLRWFGGGAVFILGIEGRLSLGNRILTERVVAQNINWHNWGGSKPSLLERDSEYQGSLLVLLSSEAIRLIEEQRKGGDVALQLELRYQRQDAIQQQPQEQQRDFRGGGVYWEQTGISWSIPHSEWLKRLKEMGWNETELFEVSVLPLKEDKNLAEALRLLSEAQGALRSCDHKSVLSKCREAFESAAKYESQGDTRKGFALLLNRAFPEHDAKPAAMDAAIKALSEYAHLGRHAQYPALHISPEEAEFVFTATVSFFSLLSRRLGKSEAI